MGIMPEKQNGLSLVELLIALAISSFLILGTAQLFIDSKRNYAFNQGQSGSMENGRFVLMVLEQQLSKTGYRAKPWEARENAFPALASTNSCPAFAAGETFLLGAQATNTSHQSSSRSASPRPAARPSASRLFGLKRNSPPTATCAEASPIRRHRPFCPQVMPRSAP